MKIIKTYESYNNIKDLDLGRFDDRIDKSLLILNDDGTYDYNGDLNFTYMDLKSLTEIPIKFRKVSGYFWCDNNELISLEGSPLEVGGNLTCAKNQLMSLEGSPSAVGGYFDCSVNNLISLEGAPLEVRGYFMCNNNYLISLQHAPLEVGGKFGCITNNLLSKACLSVLKNISFFEDNPFSISNEVIQTVSKMTYDQQMSELNFFGKYDKEAYKMLLKILEDLDVIGIKHRKDMLDNIKDNKNLNTFF
jgi:hypothetical protein